MAKTFETDQACVSCGLQSKGMVTFHHIKTRKAYPTLEKKPWNMIPACHWCHTAGYHQKGLSYMAKEYISVRIWLERHGWEYDKSVGKWMHQEMEIAS